VILKICFLSQKNAESFNLTLLGVDTVDRDH